MSGQPVSSTSSVPPAEPVLEPVAESAPVPVPVPSWRQTLGLIGMVWLGLAALAGAVQFWTGRREVLYFAASAIAVIFSFVAIFDTLFRRFFSQKG